MKKIIFVFALILLFAGCSARRVEPLVGEPPLRVEQPRRSSPTRQPSDAQWEIAPEAERFPDAGYEQSAVAQPLPAENPADHPTYFKTEFSVKDSARANNIALAASAINGTTVMPGEEFSFNDTVGSTTSERGYKKAVVYTGGEKSKNFGGGVCQVSTTLCNAAIAANMTITERHDHSLPVLYVGKGAEAATSQRGNLDFKFKNEKDRPVAIRAAAENGVIWAVVEDF